MACPKCNRELSIGEWPFPCDGSGNHILGSFFGSAAAISEKERSVYFEHPETGEVRIPGRADRPMPEHLVRFGFERRELNTLADVRNFEKRTGKVSIAANYDKHSAREDRDLGCV